MSVPEEKAVILRQLIPEYEPAVITTPSQLLAQPARQKIRNTVLVLVPLHAAATNRVSH